MKKFTTLVLVLVLTLSTLLSVVPFGAFAEATTIEDLRVYDNSVTEDHGFRKKSSGAVTFSPYLPELKAAVDAGANIADYNAVLTITRLSEKGGEELATYGPIDCGKLTRSNFYYDILVKNFYPTPGAYYNITLEIYNGSTVAFVGTYSDRIATPDFEKVAGYTPTDAEFNGGNEDPDVPEITYPITIEDTSANYLGFRYKSSSNGDVVFCPYLKTQDTIAGTTIGDVVNKNRSNYVAEITVYYQAGGKDCSSEETIYLTTFETNLEANSNGGAAYTDICIASADDTNGFCPVDGQFYTLILNIYDTNGTLLYKDGTYKNMTGSTSSSYAITKSPYYYTSDVKFEGVQTGDSAIRFVGGVSEAAVSIYDKVDLQVSFTGDGVARTFTTPIATVYKTLQGTKNGQVFNAVTVYGSGVEAEETVDAAYLFGYAVTGIPAGTYSVTVTPVAYIGETAIEGKAYTYNTVTVAADGTVTLA